MATSDNVLRAGLTTKEVAVSELLSVADFIPSEPRIIEPELDGHGEQLFAPGVQEFRLSVQQISSGESRQWHDVGPRAVLCLDGSCTFVSENNDLTLDRGESVLIGGGAGRVRVEGDGTLVSALTGGS
jgi:mannose-6-phosphate isomerase